jgi:hypothetical protein
MRRYFQSANRRIFIYDDEKDRWFMILDAYAPDHRLQRVLTQVEPQDFEKASRYELRPDDVEKYAERSLAAIRDSIRVWYEMEQSDHPYATKIANKEDVMVEIKRTPAGAPPSRSPSEPT